MTLISYISIPMVKDNQNIIFKFYINTAEITISIKKRCFKFKL